MSETPEDKTPAETTSPAGEATRRDEGAPPEETRSEAEQAGGSAQAAEREKAGQDAKEKTAGRRKKKKGPGRRDSEPPTAPETPATQTQASGPAAAQPAEPAPAAPPRKRGGGALALLALLLALGAGGGVGWLWWQGQQLQGQQAEALAQMQSRLEALQARLEEVPDRSRVEALAQQVESLAALPDRVAAEIEQLRQQQAAEAARLQNAMDRLYQRMGRSSVDWILAEAEYLLRLANERLQLAHDPSTARAALAAADERLAAVDDPALQPVREAIAREIAALEALPKLDVAGRAARIDALATQMEGLPLAQRYLPPEHPATADEGGTEAQAPSADAAWWERIWERLAKTAQSLVVVRYNEEPVAALLGPEQVAALRHALMLELELARVAMVRGDEALYRESLARAERLVTQYFDPEAAAVQAVRQALQDLVAQPVRLELPDLSESLRLLRAAKAQIGAGDGEAES